MVACVWLLLMGSFRVVRETLTMQLIGVAETGADGTSGAETETEAGTAEPAPAASN